MITIYTDGGCRNNPGLGAWAYVVVQDNKPIHHDTCTKHPTTNNEMELTAILHAVRYATIHHMFDITIFTDSQYSLNAITLWYPQWLLHNATADKKNIDLIRQIHDILKSTNIQLKWVKGHASNPFNNLADQLVNQSMDDITLKQDQP